MRYELMIFIKASIRKSAPGRTGFITLHSGNRAQIRMKKSAGRKVLSLIKNTEVLNQVIRKTITTITANENMTPASGLLPRMNLSRLYSGMGLVS